MAQSLKNAFHINSVTKSVEKVTLRALPNLENEHDYIWFQLDFLAEDVEDVLLSLGINEIMINALIKEDSRPRVDILQDELLLVVRGMNLIKGEKPEDMISVRILATKNLLITCQKKPLNSINDLIAEIGQGNPPRNTGDFIVRLNERLVMNMSEVMEDIEDVITSYSIHYTKLYDGFDDARFFSGNGFDGISKQGRVVGTDVGNNRNLRLDDVGGVEPSAQAHLHNGNIYLAMPEVVKSHSYGQLKKGRFQIGRFVLFPEIFHKSNHG